MRKWVGAALALALVGLVCAIPTVQALDKGPASINLNAQKHYPDIIKKSDKKHVNNFPHHDHQDKFLKGNQQYANFQYTDDYTCSGCHHTSHKGDQPQSCFKCKDVNKMLDKVGGQKKFEKLFHKNCRDGCHKKMKKAKKKHGPTSCGKCHKR